MTWRTYPITGFAPDIDPSTDPGALYVGTKNFLPTSKGVTLGPTMVGGSTALTANVSAADYLLKNDGTGRYILGTSTALYEYMSDGSFVDRKSAAYTTTSNLWDFTQFGNVTLAIRSNVQLQAFSVDGAPFAAVATAPSAAIMVTCGPPASPFVMVFNYTPSGGSVVPNGWKCSGLSDYTAWTDSLTTQASSGQLVEPTGPFTAAFAYRDGVVAFKQKGMYVGEYVGNPGNGVIWAWRRISDSIGCVGKNAGHVFNDVLYFVDQHGLWMFDGSYPRPIPGRVQTWFTTNIISPSSPLTDYLYVRGNSRLRVLFFYSHFLGFDKKGAAYHIDSGLWTPLSDVKASNGEELSHFLSGELVLSTDGSAYRVSSIQSGASGQMSHVLVTGMHGSDFVDTEVRGARLKGGAGSAMTAAFKGQDELDSQAQYSSLTADTTETASVVNNHIDGRLTSHYVWTEMTFTAIGTDLVGISYDIITNGQR